ncbi:MAG: hypothetical protein ABIF87_00420 [Pseudomonadota bacterium]
MKSVTQYHTDMEIQKRAFRILLKEMGLAETLRFNMSYERGSGDYAKERSQYFKDTTVDELYHEILSRRKKGRETA